MRRATTALPTATPDPGRRPRPPVETATCRARRGYTAVNAASARHVALSAPARAATPPVIEALRIARRSGGAGARWNRSRLGGAGGGPPATAAGGARGGGHAGGGRGGWGGWGARGVAGGGGGAR